MKAIIQPEGLVKEAIDLVQQDPKAMEDFFQKATSEMKIEVGKFYKTRGGKKARVYAVDGAPENPVHGSIFCRSQNDKDHWVTYTWAKQGRYINNRESIYDLVALWQEPKPKRLYAWFRPSKNQMVWTYEGDTPLRLRGDAVRAPWLDQPEERTPT